MLPFEAVHAHAPLTVLSYVLGTTQVDSVEQELKYLDQILKRPTEHFQAAQVRRIYHEAHRTEFFRRWVIMFMYASSHTCKFRYHFEEISS